MNQLFIKVIANRHFRHLWLGQITSQISLNILYFTLMLQVYSITRSNTMVSLLLIAFGAPAVVFGILAGSIVDFFDKRRVLMLCNLTRVVIILSYIPFSHNIFIIFILSALISAVTQFFIPSEAPTIPNLVPSQQLLTANSLFTLSLYLSTVIGFVVAGPTIKLVGFQNIYLIIGILMLLASYYVSLLPKLSTRNELNFKLPFIREIIYDGFAFINNNQRIKQSLMLMTFSQVLIAILSVLAPGFADKILKINLSDISLVIMLPAAFGLVIGSLWLGSFGSRILKRKIIFIGIIGTGLALCLLSLLNLLIFSLTHTFYMMMVFLILVILGVFNSFISIPSSTILQQDSQSNMRGRVYGVMTALTSGVSFLPVILSGILADIIGISPTFTIIGILVLIICYKQYKKNFYFQE